MKLLTGIISTPHTYQGIPKRPSITASTVSNNKLKPKEGQSGSKSATQKDIYFNIANKVMTKTRPLTIKCLYPYTPHYPNGLPNLTEDNISKAKALAL